MTTPQQPIDSPFGAKSTAADVLRGIDLQGQLAIITGGYSGIGIETVRALADAGADIIVPARDAARAKDALKAIPGKIAVAAMDLADLKSVRKFAADVRAARKALHLLINNAGIMACPETRVGPGWEAQFAVNHIGHFVLTTELAPLLRAARGARVVALSSIAHRRSGIVWEDVHFRTHPYDKWVAYGQSKTANALFARALDARMRADGVRAFSAHPGGILTPLQRHLEKKEMIAMGWLDENGEIPERVKALFKTPEQGASTTVWCATSPLLSGMGGVYCEDCNIAAPAGGGSGWTGVHLHAASDEAAERLWTETENMLAAA
jgi:NAD(P)-dependent dehydrogenase (short-subunit alcohol dehydrogenase family)